MRQRKTVRVMVVGVLLAGGLGAWRPALADDNSVPTTGQTAPDAAAPDAPAPDAPARGQRAGVLTRLLDRVQKIVNTLNLTDDQQKQMGALFRQARGDAGALQAQFPNLEPDERLEKIKDFWQGYRPKMMGILNDDQKAQLKEKLPAAMAGGEAGARLKQLFTALDSLDLSDDQKKQIDDLKQEIKDKGHDLAQQAADGKDVRDEAQSLRQDIRDKLQSILTRDQLDQLKDKMQEEQTQPANVPDNNAALDKATPDNATPNNAAPDKSAPATQPTN